MLHHPVRSIFGYTYLLDLTFLTGFDGSLMGGINAMQQYLDFFHYKQTGASTGIGTATPTPRSPPLSHL